MSTDTRTTAPAVGTHDQHTHAHDHDHDHTHVPEAGLPPAGGRWWSTSAVTWVR